MTRHRFRSLWYGPLLLVIASWLFPIIWTAITSFKPEGGLIGLKPVFAFPPTLDNYVELFAEQGYGPLMLNSLMIAGGATVVSILLGSLAAYALARSRLRGKEQIGLWILSLRMLPPIAIVVPFYLILNRSGLLDSYAGILLVYLSFSLPFAIWMLQGFFSEVPKSIEEAASADGAGAPENSVPVHRADVPGRDRGDRHVHLRLRLERVPLRLSAHQGPVG